MEKTERIKYLIIGNSAGGIGAVEAIREADKSGTITIKVPVANFEKAFAQLKKVASLVVRESTSGQDVTEQYVDLQARLKNKQEEEN